jgi:hypothetical protein
MENGTRPDSPEKKLKLGQEEEELELERQLSRMEMHLDDEDQRMDQRQDEDLQEDRYREKELVRSENEALLREMEINQREKGRTSSDRLD